MTDLAISAQDLSKKFKIGLRQYRHDSLKDLLAHSLTRLVSNNTHSAFPNSTSDIIWALKSVSFEVKQGETLGIIGRNGAGKSTLLKILSRITEPTTGRAEIHGRVGSLLEVGTGFDRELTGRENIYLNGAILGMSKREMDRKLDEIVDFSGVERFIDTPVKHYSSGMYVRLAFAVAAHFEPEILIVDEVLSVGDAAFQKKCLGKIGEVAKGGRTVLFVSHNLVATQTLCHRAMWIHDGRVKRIGETNQVISDYAQSIVSSLNEQHWNDPQTAPGNGIVRLRCVRVRPKDGSPSALLTMETSLLIEVEFWNLMPESHLHVTLHLYTEQQIVAFTSASSSDPAWRQRPLPIGLFRSVCEIPANLLNSGIYRVTLLVIRNGVTLIYQHDDALSFEVIDMGKRHGAWYGKEPGVVCPVLRWTTEYLGAVQADDQPNGPEPQRVGLP